MNNFAPHTLSKELLVNRRENRLHWVDCCKGILMLI